MQRRKDFSFNRFKEWKKIMLSAQGQLAQEEKNELFEYKLYH